MKYQIQSVEWLSPEEFLKRLQKNAIKYSEYADSTLLFVFRGSKSEEYEFYKARFGRNNFMHLAGIRSKTKKAVEFYEACLKGTVTREDCNPRHSTTCMQKLQSWNDYWIFDRVSVIRLEKKIL